MDEKIILPFDMTGYSRGSESTYFYLKQLKLYFDAGSTISQDFPKYICITHQHFDHSFGLPRLLDRFFCNKGKEKNWQTIIFIPENTLELFENHIQTSFTLNGGVKECNYKLIEMDSKQQQINLQKGYKLECFDLDHSVPTIGYGIFQNKKKLKKEFQNLSQKEIIERKSEVLIEEKIGDIAYLCDTTIHVFDMNPNILTNYKCIMIECTFFCPDTKDLAKQSKHIHIDDLFPICENNPDILFILIHFSKRYLDVEKEFPKDKKLPNMILWK